MERQQRSGFGNNSRNRRPEGRDGSRNQGNFRRGNFSRDNRPVEKHKATCAECGNECEVPFKPSQDRPVYCFECFKKKNPRH